jgi:hypothetical protein
MVRCVTPLHAPTHPTRPPSVNGPPWPPPPPPLGNDPPLLCPRPLSLTALGSGLAASIVLQWWGCPAPPGLWLQLRHCCRLYHRRRPAAAAHRVCSPPCCPRPPGSQQRYVCSVALAEWTIKSAHALVQAHPPCALLPCPPPLPSPSCQRPWLGCARYCCGPQTPPPILPPSPGGCAVHYIRTLSPTVVFSAYVGTTGCCTVLSERGAAGAWTSTPLGELPYIGDPPRGVPMPDWIQAAKFGAVLVPEWNMVFASCNISSAVQVRGQGCGGVVPADMGCSWVAIVPGKPPDLTPRSARARVCVSVCACVCVCPAASIACEGRQ